MEKLTDTVKNFYDFVKEDHQAKLEIDGDLKDEAAEFDIAEDVLQELVDLAGTEEDVETAAKMAYEDLVSKSPEEFEDCGEDCDEPENLALAALVVKLSEMGKVSSDEADIFLGKHIKNK